MELGNFSLVYSVNFHPILSQQVLNTHFEKLLLNFIKKSGGKWRDVVC